MSNPAPLAIRVVGETWATRRITDHRAAFAAHAACDPRAQLDQQSFISHFSFPPEFRAHFERADPANDKREFSEKGYAGPCCAAWLYWDIDCPGDSEAAHADAATLVETLLNEFSEYSHEDLLIFLSGGKGFHVGLPLVWRPAPSVGFNATAKEFALSISDRAGVTVDQGVYNKTRIFRAPNSRHAKSGLYKRWLPPDEFSSLSVADIRALAAKPEPFDIPIGPPASPSGAAAWEAAEAAAAERVEERQRFADTLGGPRLQAATLDVICERLDVGERHERLWRAAANLAELDASDDLIHALLSEAGLNARLAPSDVRRQIETGIARGRMSQLRAYNSGEGVGI